MTERRLYLVRHAKSSWKQRGLTDHDRPLAPRGRRAAKAMGLYVREHGIEPDLVLCSSATRARETLARMKARSAEVQVAAELYGAEASTLLARLHGVAATVGSVMVIAHNPGLQDLALQLARDGAAVQEKFPTGALATLTFRDGWAALGRGTAELTEFVRPRDLERT